MSARLRQAIGRALAGKIHVLYVVGIPAGIIHRDDDIRLRRRVHTSVERQRFAAFHKPSDTTPFAMSTPTTTTAAPKLRALYRSFLRELPPRPVLSKNRSPVHQRLREHFHPETSPVAAATLGSEKAFVAQAEEYLAYVRAQRTYVTLLERYNPGMGMDEQERTRLTARRVGMNLPEEYGKKKE